MISSAHRTTYTDIEIRSCLPSGWGIRAGASPTWNGSRSVWSIDVYDGADNVWTVAVTGVDAERAGRIAALNASIEKLVRRALGRKSVISG